MIAKLFNLSEQIIVITACAIVVISVVYAISRLVKAIKNFFKNYE